MQITLQGEVVGMIEDQYAEILFDAIDRASRYDELRELALAAAEYTVGVIGCDELEALAEFLEKTK